MFRLRELKIHSPPAKNNAMRVSRHFICQLAFETPCLGNITSQKYWHYSGWQGNYGERCSLIVLMLFQIPTRWKLFTHIHTHTNTHSITRRQHTLR